MVWDIMLKIWNFHHWSRKGTLESDLTVSKLCWPPSLHIVKVWINTTATTLVSAGFLSSDVDLTIRVSLSNLFLLNSKILNSLVLVHNVLSYITLYNFHTLGSISDIKQKKSYTSSRNRLYVIERENTHVVHYYRLLAFNFSSTNQISND